MEVVLNIGNYNLLVKKSLEKLEKEQIVQRIWKNDHTVWKPEPTEITNRLGWLHSPEMMTPIIQDIEGFVEEVRSAKFTHALLLGMGGSSLAPEVFRKIFGVKIGYMDLAVLDSTIPGAVLSYAKTLNPKKTLFIASTKSGGTVETLSFLKYFYNLTLKKVGKGQVGNHFIAITDPGSGLETLAKKLNFRKIFLNDPNIGGRYSVLSYFGLVPAGLIGVDLNKLLDHAQIMAGDNGGCNQRENRENTAAILGTVMAELARIGRDKLTFIISPEFEPFGHWVEQLIAESTGKEGVGILPIVGEQLLSPQDYSDDRLFVYLKLNSDTTYDSQVKSIKDSGHPVIEINLQDKYDLGGEFFRWEFATAVASYFFKINPFDQPNVEAAKVKARKMMAAYQQQGKLPEPEPTFETDGIKSFADEKANDLKEAMTNFLNKANPGQNGKDRSYVAIQAFIRPTSETDNALQELRTIIQKKYRMATTVGYGPRFLHSTGQLHKGDAGNGLFIQITAENAEDAPIPDKAGEESSSMSFGVLALAQALGDRQALLDAKRKVIRFHLNSDVASKIKKLIGVIN